METTVPQPAPSLPTHSFTHDGHDYTLRKRQDHPDAPWYLVFERRGKRIKRSLESPLVKNAVATARIIIDAVKRENWDLLDRTKLRAPIEEKRATIAQLIEAYHAATLQLDPATRTHNGNCLKLLIRRALHLGDTVDVGPRSTTLLEGALVRAFYKASLDATAALSQEARARKQRSANSIIRQARGVLKPKCIGIYRRAGLNLPDLTTFFSACKEERFEKVDHAAYRPPADTIIHATLDAWQQLDDRNMFLAIGHELSFGCRLGEVAQVRGKWHTIIEGQPFLDGRADVKNNSASVIARALDPFWTIMQKRIAEKNWHTLPDDYLLQGFATDRQDNVFRAISDWMRNLGWETQKTNHALRAYAGSQVGMRYGIWAASTWLRHSNVKTTQRFYMYFIERHKLDDPTKVAAKWAEIPAPPSPDPDRKIINVAFRAA